MTLIPIDTQFEAADSLLDLATRLGRHCLDNGGLLGEIADDEDVKEIAELLEDKVAAIDRGLWQIPGLAGNYTHMLDIDGLGDTIRLVATNHPIEYRAVLRGLCRGSLTLFLQTIESRLRLDRGTPVQLASRRVNDLFENATPHPTETLNLGHPMEHLAYGLYEYAHGDTASVDLDYGHRERIDELTWTPEQRLPRIATLHPFLGAGHIAIGHKTTTTFFDVAPTKWDLERILEQLAEVSDVQIAVLPELCLPIADALENALAANPELYPPLIVAGSAHIREPSPTYGQEIRANESRVYLDGEPIAAHRKIHPFRTKHLGGHDLEHKMSEELTSERKSITVLCGEKTHLAVVICADLNDKKIPEYLESAGVNLLLVPALTGGEGAFNGAICSLASKCQAVAVVVNADLDPRTGQGDEKPPFHVLAAVPREEPAEQSRSFREAYGRGAGRGVIDPNERLADAMVWATTA